MNAAAEAREIRKALKKIGIDPKGMVRVRSNDYITEIEIDARFMSEMEQDDLMMELNDLDLEWPINW